MSKVSVNFGNNTIYSPKNEKKSVNYSQSTASQNNGGFGAGLGYLGAKVGIGAFSILEGIWDYTAGGLADLFGADEWAEEQFANNVAGKWDESITKRFNPNKGWQFAGDVAGGVGNSLVGIAAAAIAGATIVASGGTATPAVLAAVSGVTIGLGAAGGATAQAYQKTGELGAKEYGYGALSGATEAGLEYISGAAGKVAKGFAKSTAKTVAKKSVVKGMISSGLGEAFEEGVSEMVDPYYQRWTQVDPEAKNATIKEIGYAALVGGISGALLSGVGGGEDSRGIVPNIKSSAKGASIVSKGQANGVLGINAEMIDYYEKSGIDSDMYKYAKQLRGEYEKASARAADGDYNLRQKFVIGEMQRVNNVLVFEPAVMQSKENIINNAESMAERINAGKFQDADGKLITVTAEDIKNNQTLLTQLAVQDALGHFLLDADTMTANAIEGNSTGTLADFRNLQKNATPEQRELLKKHLNIDIDNVTEEDYYNSISAFRNSGKAAKFNASSKRIALIKATRTAETKFKSATYGFKLKDGETKWYKKDKQTFAVIRQGDLYYDYNPKTNEISSDGHTLEEMNKRFGVKTKVEKKPVAKTAPVTETKAEVKTEKKAEVKEQTKVETESKPVEEVKKVEETPKTVEKTAENPTGKVEVSEDDASQRVLETKNEVETAENTATAAADEETKPVETKKEETKAEPKPKKEKSKQEKERIEIENKIKERDKANKEWQAKKRQESADTIDKAAFDFMSGTELKNKKIKVYKGEEDFGTETSLLLALFKKYNITPPIKTQGWINNALVKTYKGKDGLWHTQYDARFTESKSVTPWLEKLYQAINESSNIITDSGIEKDLKSDSSDARIFANLVKNGVFGDERNILKIDETPIFKFLGNNDGHDYVRQQAYSAESFAKAITEYADDIRAGKNVVVEVMDRAFELDGKEMPEWYRRQYHRTAEEISTDKKENEKYKKIIDDYKKAVEKSKERKESVKANEVNAKTANKTEDFGEKIGGARKDLWSKRGLIEDDLKDMNYREVEKYVKKDNVWKRPDYVAKVADGGDVGLLYAQNEIRKSLNATVDYYHNDSEESRKAKQATYIKTMREIQAMAENAKTKEDFEAMGVKYLKDNGYLEDIPGATTYGTKYKWTKAYYDNPALFDSGYYDTIKRIVNRFDSLAGFAQNEEFGVSSENKIPRGYNIRKNNIHSEDSTFYVVKGHFLIADNINTYEEALAIAKASAEKKKANGKQRYVPEQLQDVHRVGADYRKGKDATGDDFINDFAIKGGEFGNWVNETERVESLNYAYDAFCDLADALGIDLADISFKGKLNIGFGSRGQGLSGAVAHYEPLRKVINLTKMRGAGSLAHEWWHAFEDYICDDTNQSKMTSDFSKLPEKTRLAAKKLVATMNYKDRVVELDEINANRAKNLDRTLRHIDSFFKENFGTFSEDLTEEVRKARATSYRYKRTPTDADIAKLKEYKERVIKGDLNAYAKFLSKERTVVDELSDFRKEVTGRGLQKEDRQGLTHYLQNAATYSVGATETTTARVKTDFYSDAIKIGQAYAKDGGYWDSNAEMLARAFAAYIGTKTNRTNDYLSGHAFGATIVENGKVAYISPQGEELAAINSAFDDLFAAAKEDGLISNTKRKKPDTTTSYALSENALNPQTEMSKSQKLGTLQMKRAESFARENVKDYDRLSVASKLEVEWTIASGWKNGVPETEIKNVARLSAKTGIGIGYAQVLATDSNGKKVDADACCASRNGHLTIYVNPKSGRTLELCTLHELTHTLEGLPGYNELKAEALKYYASRENEKKAIDDKYRELYKNEQIRYQDEILPSELTAHYVETMLEKRGTLAKLTVESPTTMQKCIKWLKERVNMIKGIDTKAADEVQRIENMFVSTYNMNINKVTTNEDIRYALPSSSIVGSDKVLTEMPNAGITVKDVVSGDVDVKALKEKAKTSSGELLEHLQIILTNSQTAIERVYKQSGRKDGAQQTNYVRAAKYSAMNMLDVEGGQYTLDGTAKVGDSWGKIWKNVYAKDKKNDGYYQSFMLYLYHWHNTDRMTDSVMKSVLGDNVTPEVSRAEIAKMDEAYPEFRKTAEKVWQFNDNNLQMRVDAGLISVEHAENLRKMYPHYVPTYRAEDGGVGGLAPIQGRSNIKVKKTIKSASGSDKALLPIDEIVAQQTMQLVPTARMNALINDLYDTNSNEFVITKREKIDSPNRDSIIGTEKLTNSVTFYHDGEMVTAQVSNNVFKGIEAYAPSGESVYNNAVLRLASKANATFKKLVTSWNPFFSFFRNPIRDIQEAGLYTRYPLRTFTKNYGVARKEIATNGKYWQEAKAAGITAASVYSYEQGLTYKHDNKFSQMSHRIAEASNAIEMAPRMAEYISARESGKSVKEALLEAQDVTVNFGRSGTFTKMLNSTIMPFLNPSIQGMSKMVRAFTGKDAAQSFANLIIRSIMLGIGLTALNDLLNGDDDDYAALSDYIKENNYCIAVGDGNFIKIPKGRVLSVIASAYTRSKNMVAGDEDAWDGYLKTFMSQVTPVDNISRTIFSPFKDIATNTTWYGGVIEGQKFDSVESKNRYDESTSSIAIKLGQVFNYSPAKIHYLLDQYGGVITDVLLPATTVAAEEGIVAKNFIANSATNAKWSTEFYDTIEKQTYKKSAGDEVASYVVRYLNSTKSTVNELYTQKRTIQSDTNLEKDEKLTQIKIVQTAINALQKDALDNVDLLTSELKKYDLMTDDTAYYDALSVVCGSDYALRAYNKDVYTKATSLRAAGIDYDTYYDYYFGTKDFESDVDKNGDTISGSRKAKIVSYIDKMDIPAVQKQILLMSNGYTTDANTKQAVAYYISKLKISSDAKVTLAKYCGFNVNGTKVVLK